MHCNNAIKDLELVFINVDSRHFPMDIALLVLKVLNFRKKDVQTYNCSWVKRIAIYMLKIVVLSLLQDLGG